QCVEAASTSPRLFVSGTRAGRNSCSTTTRFCPFFFDISSTEERPVQQHRNHRLDFPPLLVRCFRFRWPHLYLGGNEMTLAVCSGSATAISHLWQWCAAFVFERADVMKK